MSIQFACPCGEPLCFADELSGSPATCPRCGHSLTVPRLGIFVGAGDKLPPPSAPKKTDKPVPVAAPFAPPPPAPPEPEPERQPSSVPIAAPFAPPPASPPAAPARRRILRWLAAAAVLLLAFGSLPFLLRDSAPSPPPESPSEEEGTPGNGQLLLARVRQGGTPEPRGREVGVLPIGPRHPDPDPGSGPDADPQGGAGKPE